jgi:hypothetical protein
MKEKDLVYVQINQEEAINSKGAFLSSEANLLRIIRSMRKYRDLRMEELGLKMKLQKQLKDINLDIKKIREMLPKVETEQMNENRIGTINEVKSQQVKEKNKDFGLESELYEIQNRLRELQSR